MDMTFQSCVFLILAFLRSCKSEALICILCTQTFTLFLENIVTKATR